MPNGFAEKTVASLFDVKSGDYHALEELDLGTVPLVACGEADNGVVGLYDIPEDKRYHRAITVAYNGRPLTTKFHPYEFGTKDDVAVLVPLLPMDDAALLYVAALLDRQKWRYSYGRKCYREKLSRITLTVPVRVVDGEEHLSVGDIFDGLLPLEDAAGTIIRDALAHTWPRSNAEDQRDLAIALECLTEAEAHPEKVLRGEALEERLREWLA
jgi:hypothetical protein